MAGRVITIAQRKGGAGKTTLAAQLAVAWARSGARVALLDIDPQGSLAAWVALRRERLGDAAIGFEFAALPGWRAEQWIADRAREADLVVVDGPPHAETEARIAVRAAGLVLIPVQPSPLDLWATEATLAMARDERRAAVAVLNRVPPRSTATERIAADLAKLGAGARGQPHRQSHRAGSRDGPGSGRTRNRRRQSCRRRDRRARRANYAGS